MRVIAGKAKHLPLQTIPGNGTRPTTDRIKETLFNILQEELSGIRFLDLFAGSGAIGIEALSRGAAQAVFVENNRRAVDCIRKNLLFTKLEPQAVVLRGDVFAVLKKMEGEKPFQIIFMDPPYGMDLEKQVLLQLADSSLLAEETLLVVEAAKKTDFSYLPGLGYEILRKKEYQTNLHLFLKKGQHADEESSVSGQL